ncbi:MAG: hypothetical protein ACM3UZ_16970 [Acidobacteriota bacterium]
MTFKRFLLAILIVLLLVAAPSSCAPVDDQKVVLAFVDRYFEALKKSDYEKLTYYYYPGFFDNIPRDQWLAQLARVNGKYGGIMEHKLDGRDVDYTSGYVSGKLYFTFEYEVVRQKGTTRDKIVVRKAGDQIEIMSHQINEN